MAGRPDFSTPGSQGSGQTIAVNERPEIATQTITNTANVSAGTTQDTEIYAPAGSIYEMEAFEATSKLDADATSGFRRYVMFQAGDARLLEGDSNYNSDLVYQYQHWRNADKSQFPTTEQAQQQAITGKMATENSPIKVRFNNQTDVTHTVDRSYLFVFKEVSY